jgi:hypothetical protein
MRISEFWALVEGEFGAAHGRTLARDQVLPALGYRTARQALDAGEDPREVWLALCQGMQVPSSRWWGPEQSRTPRR